jgi:hypothetical protein
MINVDTVYQKILALANKEQRGYITPQEFNLMADKAQMDLYSTYFHDLKMAYHKQTKTQNSAGDEYDMIESKLHPFKKSTSITQLSGDGTLELPSDLFYIDVLLNNGNEVSELTKKEIAYTQNNPLLKATTSRMVFTRETISGTNIPIITLYPTPSQAESNFDVHYYKRPKSPNWGYVVVSDKALYNDTTSVDFELHASEEEVLVTRILELSGLVIRSEDLAQAAMVDKANTIKQQND